MHLESVEAIGNVIVIAVVSQVVVAHGVPASGIAPKGVAGETRKNELSASNQPRQRCAVRRAPELAEPSRANPAAGVQIVEV